MDENQKKKITFSGKSLYCLAFRELVIAGIAAIPGLTVGNPKLAAAGALTAVTGDGVERLAKVAQLAGEAAEKIAEGFSSEEKSVREQAFDTFEAALKKELHVDQLHMDDGIWKILRSGILEPQKLLDLLSCRRPDWHRVLKQELERRCLELDLEISDADLEQAAKIIESCADDTITANQEIREGLYLNAQYRQSIGEGVHLDNEKYVESFLLPLFLHKQKPNAWKVTLQNLYVMPKYKDLAVKDAPVQDDLEALLADFIQKQEDVPFLLIEGDAGNGKTTLSAWLNVQYSRIGKGDGVGEKLFGDRKLVTVRLRDLADGSLENSEHFLEMLLLHLHLNEAEDLNRQFPKPVLLLDGFDELCMVKSVAENQGNFFRSLYEKACAGHWKVLLTSRPTYFHEKDVSGMNYRRIVLEHFDDEKRKEWLYYYAACSGDEISKETIIFLDEMEKSEAEGVCDTPMMLYMLAADGETGSYMKNPWALYRHVFAHALSQAQYNKTIDRKSGSTHHISDLQNILYRISEEIAFAMFQNSSKQFFLREDALKQIIRGLQSEFPELEDQDTQALAEQCYGLCCYWKPRESSDNGHGSTRYSSLDLGLDRDLCPVREQDQGAVEFLHNNIRDFFLAEKIYRELNRTVVAMQDRSDTGCEALTDALCRLLWYGELPSKSLFFIYHRAVHEKERREHQSWVKKLDFAGYEAQHQQVADIFEDMSKSGICGDGESRPGILSQKTDLPLIQRVQNIVKNTMRLYRHAYEPYLNANERIHWFHNNSSNPLYIPCYLGFGNLLYHLLSIILEGTRKLDDLYHPSSRADFSSLYYSQISLRVTDLTSASLKNTILEYADLRGADLAGANLQKAVLNNGTLEGANLQSADLSDVDLSGISLLYASLQDANLTFTNLSGSNLTSSDLTGADLRGASLPGGFQSFDQKEQVEHLKSLNIPGLKI